MVWDNLLFNSTAIFRILVFVMLIGISMGILYKLDMMDIPMVLILYAVISIFLYAYGVLDLFYASFGYIIVAVFGYFIFKGKGVM